MKHKQTSRLRVLVFDDNDVLRSTLRELLRAQGWEVFSFADPAGCPLHQARQCTCTAEEVCADAIITDVDMPHIAGLDFIAELKEKGCKIRNLAMLSAHEDEETLARAVGLGCRPFCKPGGIPALLAWLATLEASGQPGRCLAPWLSPAGE